jgi:hypothetical protein
LAHREWRTEHEKKIIGELSLVSIAYWRGGHRSANILAQRGPPAPINWRSDVKNVKKNVKKKRTDSSVRLAYFQANRLLTELYKQETEIR